VSTKRLAHISAGGRPVHTFETVVIWAGSDDAEDFGAVLPLGQPGQAFAQHAAAVAYAFGRVSGLC